MQPLVDFVDQHRGSLSDPYEGEPLDEHWQASLVTADVQEVGDYALTRYYAPAADEGLGEEWMEIESGLDAVARRALLGTPFGPTGNEFDPGRMGSYFQSPDAARDSWVVLSRLGNLEIAGYVGLLESASKRGKGIYVTF